MYIHIFIHSYTYACMHAYIHTHMYIHIYILVHTFACMYTHTYSLIHLSIHWLIGWLINMHSMDPKASLTAGCGITHKIQTNTIKNMLRFYLTKVSHLLEQESQIFRSCWLEECTGECGCSHVSAAPLASDPWHTVLLSSMCDRFRMVHSCLLFLMTTKSMLFNFAVFSTLP